MIGRIEYTSCEDGVDGISGFQIRAMTPGIAAALRSAVLRDSVYEPPPGSPAVPGPDELARFPVAFGYAYAPEGTVVHRTSYVGRDHTGRWGNYFAQALTADRGEPIADLPIDLWESPVWRPASTRAGVLEPVRPGDLVAGPDVGASATASFLGVGNRGRVLAGLLALVRGALSSDSTEGGRGARLVVIAADSAEAAQWVAAVTRSLPAALAWRVTFTTYASRPESHTALLTCTTPDVTVAAYGNYRVVDLRGPEAAGDVPLGAYERVAAELWPTGEMARLVGAVPVDPPLGPDELDRFAWWACLFESLPVPVEWQEADLLDGLEHAVQRAPDSLLEPWDRVAAAARELGELADLARWGSVLSASVDRGAPVPGPLMQHYTRSAVAAVRAGTAPGSLWLPAPALAMLAGQVESPEGFEEFATTTGAGAADAIARLADAHPRLRLAAEVALARQGGLDPVDVATRFSAAALPDRADWARATSLLWPGEPPTVAQADALLDRLPGDVLAATGLAEDHLVQRLLEDCGRGLTEADHALARRLGDRAGRDPQLLSPGARTVVDLVGFAGYLETRPPYAEAIAYATFGVREASGSVAPVLADRFGATLAGWLLALDWADHRSALRAILLPADPASRRFFAVYADVAEAGLAAARPVEAAEIITAWRRLVRTEDTGPGREEAERLQAELLEDVLVRGLARAGRGHLERIGKSPVAMGRANLPQDPFPDWWTRWQRRHERPGLLNRLRVRGRD